MNVKHQSVIARYWQFISLGAVIALAVLLSASHNFTQAQEPTRPLTIPAGSTGLSYGESFRATLTNLSNQRVSTQIRILDTEGTVLKQEALVLEPNQMRAVTLSREEVGRGEANVLVRAEAIVIQTDAPHLWLTGEVINSVTGGTQFITTSGNGPLMGSSLNHNETLVSDQP